MRYWITILVGLNVLFGNAQLDSARMLQFEHAFFLAIDQDSARQILKDKFNYAASENSFDRSQLQLLYRLRDLGLDSLNTKSYYWNLSLLSHIHGEFRASWYAMEEYRRLNPNFEYQHEWLLYVLISSQYAESSLEDALNAFKLSSFYTNELYCIEEQMRQEMKRKQGLVLLSYFIPGSGLMFNGNIGEGTGALLLNGGIAIGLTALVLNAAYINAGLWLFTWVPKFYLGNIELTKRRILTKQQAKKNERTSECALIWKNVLEEENLRLLLFN